MPRPSVAMSITSGAAPPAMRVETVFANPAQLVAGMPWAVSWIFGFAAMKPANCAFSAAAWVAAPRNRYVRPWLPLEDELEPQAARPPSAGTIAAAPNDRSNRRREIALLGTGSTGPPSDLITMVPPVRAALSRFDDNDFRRHRFLERRPLLRGCQASCARCRCLTVISISETVAPVDADGVSPAVDIVGVPAAGPRRADS